VPTMAEYLPQFDRHLNPGQLGVFDGIGDCFAVDEPRGGFGHRVEPDVGHTDQDGDRGSGGQVVEGGGGETAAVRTAGWSPLASSRSSITACCSSPIPSSTVSRSDTLVEFAVGGS